MTTRKMTLAVLIGSLVFLSACGGADSEITATQDQSTASSGNQGITPSPTAPQGDGNGTATADGLTVAEKDSLAFMREEEKLAHDVYVQLDAIWGANSRTFANIAQSETSHTEAVRDLLDRYGMADPAAETPVGVFVDPRLQSLHDQLVQNGTPSLIAALTVGVTIEELDMHDIQEALTEVASPEIIQVYENLLKGSRNHLRSYYAALLNAGGNYTPQYISAEAFTTIVTTPMERG